MFDRLVGILHAVNERVVRLELLARRRHVVLHRLDSRLRFRSQAGLQSPAAEQQDARISLAESGRHHGIRIFVVSQFALEDLGLEIVLLVGQAQQARATSPD